MCVTAGGPKAHHPAPCSVSRALPQSKVRHCAEFHSTTLRCVGAATPSWAEHRRPGRPSDSRCRVDAQICSPRRYRIPWNTAAVRAPGYRVLVSRTCSDTRMVRSRDFAAERRLGVPQGWFADVCRSRGVKRNSWALASARERASDPRSLRLAQWTSLGGLDRVLGPRSDARFPGRSGSPGFVGLVRQRPVSAVRSEEVP